MARLWCSWTAVRFSWFWLNTAKCCPSSIARNSFRAVSSVTLFSDTPLVSFIRSRTFSQPPRPCHRSTWFCPTLQNFAVRLGQKMHPWSMKWSTLPYRSVTCGWWNTSGEVLSDRESKCAAYAEREVENDFVTVEHTRLLLKMCLALGWPFGQTHPSERMRLGCFGNSSPWTLRMLKVGMVER